MQEVAASTLDGDMETIRLAEASDIELLCAFDRIAQQQPQRREFIARRVENGQCFVCEHSGQVKGYAVLEYTFFEQGFISMLYIHPGQRRMGHGLRLMAYLESICRTPKIFTSTNLSNLPMQALLAKAGYQLSGVVHNLDEGDPELIYVKFR